MPSLSEILNSSAGYTPVPGYTVNNNYTDNKEVNIIDHSIGGISGVTTHREIDAQYVVFKVPRKPDGFDLLNTHLKIYYEMDIDEDPYMIADDADPINVMASEDYILMGWLIPLAITQTVGSFRYIIHAYQQENEELVYHWKSLPASYSISETLIPGEQFVEPETSWYEDFIARMESYIAVVAGGIHFKGTIGTGGTVTVLPTNAEPGDQYLVITAGTYSGHVCKIGDYLINKSSNVWIHVVNLSSEFINISEAYAKGTIDGVPVTSGQPGYHDNSKYYKDQAATSASTANTAKTDAVNAKDTAVSAKNDAVSAKDTAVSAKNTATTKAAEASNSATSANTAKLAAEAARDQAVSIVGSLDSLIKVVLTGGVTKQQYESLMKTWFEANGCYIMMDLTTLVQKWYDITRIGWNGGTKFSATTESSVSTGTAIGDNIGLNCTPSTNTIAGTDNYASLPMFAIKDANVTLDVDGDPHVIAIEGIPSGVTFDRYDPTKVVEVLQMCPWMKYSEDATSYSWEYTDEIGKAGYIPWPSAVSLKDNSVRTWVHHVKYPFGDDWSACSGRKIKTGNISHNSQITGIHTKWGNRYCGKSCSDDAWVKHMTYIKYKSLTLDNIMNGCLNYYIHNLHPAIAEENVERIIMTPSSVAAVIVGSSISLSSTDMAATGSIVDRAVITSIEDVVIDGTTYKAINVDNGGVKFNTTLESIFYTWHWRTGSTDNVKGNDGSPYSNTSTKEPYKIQGIEQIVGCYEVMGDTILSYIDGYQVPHVCRDASKLATSITADYKRCSFGFPQPAASGWQYSKKLGFDPNLPELSYPSESGGSSSTFTEDGYYIEGVATADGLREWLAFGDLDTGLTNGGLSCLLGHYGLTTPHWSIGGRLSSNGNRGEFEPSAA